MSLPNPQATIQNMFAQSTAVLTQPSVATFERFERRGGVREAFIYVLLAAVVSAVISGLFALLPFHHVSAGAQFFTSLISIPVEFGIFTGLVYFVGQQLFKGTGTYPEVAYTFALFFVPISIASTIIGIIPILGWLVSFILGLVNVYFGFLAVQSSMNIREQGSAVVTLVLSWIGAIIVNVIVGALIAVPFVTRAILNNN
ncbi:YIP1 family protein [Deinococcus sp. KNUC1210]|uniref:YIP1 family protein n=1 Tax=Deinococcus sp. KNUC1210 TaxID=2917691 RepID=UPI001EF0CB6D|nr:YIP1 family protein [Deinococcus sp. KNUC1210]ULH14924.1 YIP1 family protein [Deinococcus sp. KNUC1210]